MSSKSIPFSHTPGGAVSVYVLGKYKVLPPSHRNYLALIDALHVKPQNYDLICELADISTFLARVTLGEVQISDDKVLWRGESVHGVIVDRILQHLHLGYDLTPLANFLAKLMLNPIVGARDDLFAWLESGNAPITPDGNFIAFKNVRLDYLDHYSASIDNSVGTTPSMPIEDVDQDRYNECSSGLHFCSFAYLSSFHLGQSHTMVLEIDPANVVAIPTDYNRQKGRCWTYKVIAEVEGDKAATIYEGKPVVQPTTNVSESGVAETTATADEIPFKLGGIIIATTHEYSSITFDCPYQVVDCDNTTVTIIDDDYDSFDYDVNLFRAPVEGDLVTGYPTEDDAFSSEGEDEGDESSDVPWNGDSDESGITEDLNTTLTTATKVERQFYSKVAAKTLLESEVRSLLQEHGQRGMSRLTGIPRTTIQEWVKTLST